MFTSAKSKQLFESNEFGKQTSNAIRVGRYFSGIYFIDGDKEFSVDELFNYLYGDDIKYLADAIDGELFKINDFGQKIQVSDFQALCNVCDQFGLIIKI